MPWPMVHFAVANEICLIDVSPSLLIGSIAPDAVHMRGNVTRQEKGSTHLVCDDQFPRIDIIRDNCLKYLNERTELEWNITDDEVNQYRDVKLEWLLNETNEPKIELSYFLEEKVRAFIVETAVELNQLFKEWNVELRV
ncbi:hypothetical protein [Paenibacillus segetis]|uniref:Uncharacterized protein n=1 Tax=Paenibacillus segetis TaxID=1325360 RepID=A0ABQ1YK85_9BACL|nr:hypothetical protein [Paenibacillus segetis]GGH27234.1 hypothetical protein GCM10008013_28570 [Paenibacillus segetis]